jgi:Restriction endonuclease
VNPLYPSIAERAAHRCEYCHAPEQVFNFAFEVEHITPRSAGGSDAENNLALVCESCNLFKSNATTGWDEAGATWVPLFHPREDRWEDHFQFDHETAQILGLTATGRATVTRLRMNSDFQIRARIHGIRLTLYP